MKNNNLGKLNQQGFGLIEAVVGIIVALIIILSFTALITRAVTYSSINGKQLKATLYLQEMVEVAKDLEQSDWDSLNNCISVDCYPEISASSTWILSMGRENNIEGIYDRWLTIEHVCRDISSATPTYEILPIPCHPAHIDYSSSTKKIIAEIEWDDQLGSQYLELEAYLYNYNYSP